MFRNAACWACVLLISLVCPSTSDATWSIVLADADTGEVAVGTVTCLNDFDLLALVPVVVVGKGGAAVQSAGDFDGIRRPIIFEELLMGTSPEEILQILEGVSGHNNRQYGIVDTQGRKVTFSGFLNGDWAGGVVGSQCSMHYAIQGNVLAGPCVIEAVEQAVLETEGDFAAKLMAGMQAARSMGGDGRCSCSPSDPPSCGCPVPNFAKAGHIGGMVVARIGDTDDPECDADGCVDGDYFMRFNVAFQSNGDPDPVAQLQEQFDEWRASLVGRPDGWQSQVTFDPLSIPPDGTSTTTMNIVLADWAGGSIEVPISSLTVQHASKSAGLTSIGPVVDNGDGTFSVVLTAGNAEGIDRFVVTVDDGVRPVLLMPNPALEFCTEPNCLLDCNDNGLPDLCDLGSGTSADCNNNIIPDECDVANGTSLDCNENVVPDECEPDCNDNNVADSCDIASGSSTDEDGNGVPDDCHAILRVPTDFETIQAAIDVAVTGDTVFISDGTYSGPGNTELDFGGLDLLAKSVNGPANCTIDGQNTARIFLFQSGESRAAIVEGLTMINGLAAQGGAINCINGSSPTIRDCVFADNLASDKGGAVHTDSSGPVITRCKFFGNTAQGARGGGALYVRNSSDQGELEVDNCLIAGNSANRGGAIYFLGSSATIRHCTIIGNSANSGGAFYSTAASNPVVTNSILWHDSAPEGPEITIGSSTSFMTVAYSNVEGGAKNVAGIGTLIWEQGNIGEDSVLHDPRFSDADGPDDDPSTPADNDYHLLIESPSVDTGDPAFTLDLGTVDLDGRGRLEDGDKDGEAIVDMGCFERGFCPADIDGDGSISPVDLAALLAAWGPNPGHPADINGDGIVDPVDLATLLGAWGVCL